MPIYLYGLVAPVAEPSADLRGVAGEPVRLLEGAPVGAWIGTVARAPAVSAEAAEAHDRVLRAALARATSVVAARFGQVLGADSDWVARLEEQREKLTEALNAVSGQVEMGVVARLAPVGDSPPSGAAGPRSGRDYLAMLRSRQRLEDDFHRAAAALVKAIDDPLQGFARRRETTARPATGMVAVSHLIARESAADYRRVAERLQLPGVDDHLVAGPSAPSSFVTVGAGR